MNYRKLINHLKSIDAGGEDKKAIEEAIDIISDYEKIAEQNSSMIKKYEIPKNVVRRRPGTYTCPLCGKIAGIDYSYCNWCGKKLSWKIAKNARRNGGGKY